jgi:hypothetical protein
MESITYFWYYENDLELLILYALLSVVTIPAESGSLVKTGPNVSYEKRRTRTI